ncbi:MAG: DUF6290 family protein [Streptococcaceae bacterium]|nr:DUF6290 family protein [Streptococcaceae bacterium]MCL2680914.1 DUF6290 family protein [Streptococcaceae bacterium]MCL2858950.1 DUF6290 family protein [Streptococcaceae bacterium]
MTNLTLRIDEKDKELIQKFAKFNGLSVSEFLRTSALEAIEDAQDLKDLRQAKIENNNQEGKTITEVMAEMEIL